MCAQELFAYQGVYQRHLIKHLEKKEITDDDLAPLIAESHRLAEEISIAERDSVQVLDDEEADKREADEAAEASGEPEEAAEQEQADEEDENGGLVEEEEAHIAQKLQSRDKVEAGNAR